jgi:hypothetical protein
MATQTARRHVRNALRSRLGISDRTARDIVQEFTNHMSLWQIDMDLRGCVAVVGNDRTGVSLYLPDADGVLVHVEDLVVEAEHLARWKAMPLEQAYGLPDGLKYTRDGDDFHSPSAHGDDGSERLPTAANDHDGAWLDVAADAGDQMDALFGPIPEPKRSETRDGTLLAAAVVNGGSYVQALVEIDGVETPFAMMPLFGTADDLVGYAGSRIGVASRFFIDLPHPLHRAREIPEGMSVVEMIVPLADLPGLYRSLRQAA